MLHEIISTNLSKSNKTKTSVMKKIIFVLLGITTAFITQAQSNKEDIDIIQGIYGKEKKAIVAEFIIPSDAKKTAFWKLYDAYEAERKALGRKRIALLEKYANAYDSLTNKTTDDITKQTIALQKSTDGLISTYYEKIKLAVGVKQAAQF